MSFVAVSALSSRSSEGKDAVLFRVLGSNLSWSRILRSNTGYIWSSGPVFRTTSIYWSNNCWLGKAKMCSVSRLHAPYNLIDQVVHTQVYNLSTRSILYSPIVILGSVSTIPYT